MKPAPPRRAAFTLIELLTVIAIIGILAAIIIPVVGKVRGSAQSAQCVSNLRQIGVAINLYTNDYRETLPGPVNSRFGFEYAQKDLNSGSIGSLGKILSQAGYLPFVETTANVYVCETFKCPSWVASGATTYRNTLHMNVSPWRDADGQVIYPFGYSSGSKPVMKLSSISDQPLSRTWLLVDMDNPLMQQVGWGTDTNLPQKTVHGSSRNVLFYDGHVQKIPDSKKLADLLNP